eukprot:scaffold237949_cov54-Attheya_sp.AAC.11
MRSRTISTPRGSPREQLVGFLSADVSILRRAFFRFATVSSRKWRSDSLPQGPRLVRFPSKFFAMRRSRVNRSLISPWMGNTSGHRACLRGPASYR